VLVLLAVLVATAIQSYNALIALQAQLERAWANIDVILKQRYDEIAQLIQVIEQYAGFEAQVVRSLADARSRYGSARDVSEKIDAAQAMSVAMRGVAAIGEAYPELRTNQSFLQLQSRISALESAIADRREAYNETVANFNTRIEQFPTVFLARFLAYQRQRMFEVTEVERTSPSLAMKLPAFE
jgi:LemA protein